MQRHGHPLLIRFGAGAPLKSSAVPDPARVLGEQDTFHVDIGLVRDGYGGHAGDPFAVGGDDPQGRQAG